MTDWRWVALDATVAIHHRQLSEHGGLAGIRDQVAIESALARPLNLAAYGNPDLADLAAAYGYGLARNYGFADGNKRTAWVVMRLFLADNGARLRYDAADAVRLVEGVAAGAVSEAAGAVSEQDLAAWLRERLSHPKTSPATRDRS